jgi:hypothetical protein
VIRIPAGLRKRCGVVMTNTKERRHPALKHGAYSATAVLPGESRAEFEKLHCDLIAEFAPSGALEDDIVMSLAQFIWRKQNLATLRKAERARDSFLTNTGEVMTFVELTRELEIYERLDAAINRCFKQLLMARGIKSMTATPLSASPKVLAAPPTAA